jgi:hypothetical protein
MVPGCSAMLSAQLQGQVRSGRMRNGQISFSTAPAVSIDLDFNHQV